MRGVVRWAVVVIVVLHGVFHMVGAGPGWWLAAVLVVGAGVLMGFQVRHWWMVAAVAAITSQAMILGAWPDAWAETAGNVVLLLAAAYGLASQGPGSLRRRYRDLVAAVLSAPAPAGVVTESDLDGLPAPVAAYVRRSGAVAGPRITSFHACMHGRIRQGPDKPWMPFTAEQVNTCRPRTSRLFLMDATMFGLPVDVLHTFVGPDATMRAKVCSIVPVADAAGPDMARAETVTLLNDLCIFAPAALIDAPITWEAIDDRRARATYVNAAHTVTAELVFNDQAELVDFVSEDRLAASPDGSTFTPQRWSTPLQDHRQVGPYRLATAGEGRWHPDGKPRSPTSRCTSTASPTTSGPDRVASPRWHPTRADLALRQVRGRVRSGVASGAQPLDQLGQQPVGHGRRSRLVDGAGEGEVMLRAPEQSRPARAGVTEERRRPATGVEQPRQPVALDVQPVLDRPAGRHDRRPVRGQPEAVPARLHGGERLPPFEQHAVEQRPQGGERVGGVADRPPSGGIEAIACGRCSTVSPDHMGAGTRGRSPRG